MRVNTIRARNAPGPLNRFQRLHTVGGLPGRVSPSLPGNTSVYPSGPVATDIMGTSTALVRKGEVIGDDRATPSD
jgi:hypothetical protein